MKNLSPYIKALNASLLLPNGFASRIFSLEKIQKLKLSSREKTRHFSYEVDLMNCTIFNQQGIKEALDFFNQDYTLGFHIRNIHPAYVDFYIQNAKCVYELLYSEWSNYRGRPRKNYL